MQLLLMLANYCPIQIINNMNIFEETGSQLVGFSGTNGSGKDTGSNYLAERQGFMHVSISDMLREEATRRGLDHERPTLVEVGFSLNEQYGPGAGVLRAIERWREQRSDYLGGLVVSSIRVVAEGEAIKRHGGTLLFSDAPEEIRYERSLKRLRDDQTSITLQEFIEREQTELRGLAGPDRPNLRAVQAMADATIINDKTMDEYTDRIATVLSLPLSHEAAVPEGPSIFQRAAIILDTYEPIHQTKPNNLLTVLAGMGAGFVAKDHIDNLFTLNHHYQAQTQYIYNLEAARTNLEQNTQSLRRHGVPFNTRTEQQKMKQYTAEINHASSTLPGGYQPHVEAAADIGAFLTGAAIAGLLVRHIIRSSAKHGRARLAARAPLAE